MKNSVGGFAKGFSYPFRAGHFLLSHPRLYPYVLIPFLINLVVFSLAVWLGLDFYNTTVEAMIPIGEAWYWSILYYFLWLIAVLATALMVFFLFAIVGNLIASPFNDILSEKTEEMITGVRRSEPFQLRLFLRESVHILLDELIKISAFLFGMVLLFLFLLLPAVGPVLYSILSILWTALFLVVEYTGYIFSRHQLVFKDQRQFIRQRKLASVGFGTGALCLLAIPFLQFFTIPLGVIGAVHFWRDSQSPQLPETLNTAIEK
jgi:CysZ protein